MDSFCSFPLSNEVLGWPEAGITYPNIPTELWSSHVTLMAVMIVYFSNFKEWFLSPDAVRALSDQGKLRPHRLSCRPLLNSILATQQSFNHPAKIRSHPKGKICEFWMIKLKRRNNRVIVLPKNNYLLVLSLSFIVNVNDFMIRLYKRFW